MSDDVKRPPQRATINIADNPDGSLSVQVVYSDHGPHRESQAHMLAVQLLRHCNTLGERTLLEDSDVAQILGKPVGHA